MLIDQFGRAVEYLRISVTDRCDLRCTYCIPKGFKGFEVHEHWLTFDEIIRIARVFAESGTRHIRITGGEPLLRKDIVTLVRSLKEIPNIDDLSMTTNATQLARYASSLKEAGLDRLNISLDSLNSETIRSITGLDCLAKVSAGILAAKEAGFKQIKINMVPMKDINDHEIEDMIRFCAEHNFILRMIETMPMGETGRGVEGRDLSRLLAKLSKKYGLIESTEIRGGGPARYWISSDKHFTLGLITPISQHFCETCNRVRLSVDGTLYMCLGQNDAYPLRDLLRSGCSDELLLHSIKDAINLKPERHEFKQDVKKIARYMSMTGG